MRAAARNVQTNQQRVQSARASRELQEKKLEAEEKKLAAGMSSPFFVVQAQRDLSLARTVEIQAISDYNKSLVDFEAVQQVPLNGGLRQLSGAGRALADDVPEETAENAKHAEKRLVFAISALSAVPSSSRPTRPT